MRRLVYILTFVLCTLSLCTWSQDFARLGERTIMGTARYVGMSGAMTAIGGDPSAVHDNPAGLGLYRRAEVTLSFDEAIDKTWQRGLMAETKSTRYTPMVPQVAIVLSIPYKKDDEGVLFNNFLLSYRRLHSYGRTMYGVGQNGYSLGALLETLDVPWDIKFCTNTPFALNDLLLKESGSINEFAFDWSVNLSNRWFIGAGLQVQSYTLSADASYIESFANSSAYNKNVTTLIYSGVSSSLSLGLIYRPTGWLRLGASIQSNSLGTFHIYSSGTLSSQTDSLRFSYAPEATAHQNNIAVQPLHFSSSVAFQIGAYGMVALQYDLYHQPQETPVHSLRAGLEIIPVLGLYLNAGYACESTFKNSNKVVSVDPTFDRQDTYFQKPNITHYASFAIGYRGTHILAQAAYQYRWQRFNLYAHEYVAPYDFCADTHRLVFTIGWHRN